MLRLRREALLAGAGTLLRERPWEEIAVDDLARAAGIPRSTFYTVYGSRQKFAGALLAQERERLLADLEGTLGENAEHPERAAQAVFELLLAAARRDAFGLALVVGEGCDGVGPQLARLIGDAWPFLAAAEAQLLGDLLRRLALSRADQSGGPDRLSGDGIARLLEPYLVARRARLPRL